MGAYYLRSCRIQTLQSNAGPVVVLSGLGWKGVSCCGSVGKCTDAVHNSNSVALVMSTLEAMSYWADSLVFCISPPWHRENRKANFVQFCLCHSRKRRLPKDVIKIIFSFVVGPVTGDRATVVNDLDFYGRRDVTELAAFVKRRKDCHHVWSTFLSEEFTFYGCCFPFIAKKQTLREQTLDEPVAEMKRKASFHSLLPPESYYIPEREDEDD